MRKTRTMNGIGFNVGCDRVAQVCNLPYRGFVIGNRGIARRLAGCKPAIQQLAKLRYVAAFSLALLCAVGCRTIQPLPKFDLSEQGWTVRNGQAVWHVPEGKTEVAGEVIVATKTDGHSFVQFSKAPFPLVIARASSRQWEVEFPPQNKHYSGRGAPPLRVIWLWLPRVLSGETPPKNWSWKNDGSGWRLENPANGEFVEGYFAQ